MANRIYARHESEVRLYLIPAFEGVLLAELSAADVRRFGQDMMDAAYASSTPGHVHGVSSTDLNQVVADGVIPRNLASPRRSSRRPRISPAAPCS